MIKQAQTNLSGLNTLLWGICNTVPTADQCVANMGWFAQELQTVCKIDLQNRVALAVDSLTGLQAFGVMREAGCAVDQSTQTYCYADAVHSTNPSDLYFYQLALGTPLPNITTPSCSACTKTVMGIFAQQATNLSSLELTYPPAASAATKTCGQAYAESVVSSARRAVGGFPGVVLWIVVGALGIWSVS